MQVRYDRGTVVLDRAHATAELPAPLAPPGEHGLRWDPRVRRWRAPAHLASRLIEALGPDTDSQMASLLQAAAPLGSWRPVPLRGYQQEGLQAWRDADSVGVVCLPTGSGKTRVALAAMKAASTPALVVVPTRALLRQWVSVIRRFYSGAVGQFGDGSRSLGAITVTTFASAWSNMPSLGCLFPLLVVDEAHHVNDGQLCEALSMSLAPARLGLTATPSPEAQACDPPAGRSNRQDSPRRLLGPVVFEIQVDDLVGTALAPYDIVKIRVRLDASQQRAHDGDLQRFRPVHAAWKRSNPEQDWLQFVRAASRDPELREALAAWHRARRLAEYPPAKDRVLRRLLMRHACGRTLVFTPDNATTYQISSRHLIAPITCHTRPRERAQTLADFSAHRIAALVSAKVLNEGLDLPEADTGIIIGGAGGRREFTQRLGRLLRPSPGKRARIYELLSADTVDVWRRRRAVPPSSRARADRPVGT